MKKLFSFLILGLFFVMLASAEPPFQTTEGREGITIWYPQLDILQYNTSVNVHLHVTNTTTGAELPSSTYNCTSHLYDRYGNHIDESPNWNNDGNGREKEYTIGAGNFTETGYKNSFYIYCIAGGEGDAVKGSYVITSNGRELPTGITILGFIIIMILIFMFTIVYLIRGIGLIIEASFDILDIAYAWGLFFGLLGINLLASIYLGNLEIQNFLGILIKILAFPLVIVPIIAFFLSLFRAKKKQEEKENQW